jgi:TctA family transporter
MTAGPSVRFASQFCHLHCSPSEQAYFCGVAGLGPTAGYWLRRTKYPLAPLVVAVVLGDSTERTFRQSLIASGGSSLIFVGSPLSATLIVLAAILLRIPLIRTIRSRGRGAEAAIEQDTVGTALD